jgi:tetratricopeptide (TPR) repeat protein
MRRFLLLLTVLLLMVPVTQAQEAKIDLEKVFTAANALLEKEKYAEALVEYQKILAVEPDQPGALQNGGMAAFFAGDYKTSLAYYKKLKAEEPNNGFLLTRLVQVYQALGDEKARDAERAEVIALHKSGKDTSTIAKRSDFCRDQYRLGSHQIRIYEPFVFEPRNKEKELFGVVYQIIVDDAKGSREMRIEVGWDTATKDAKGIYQPGGAFYFDAYYPTGPVARRTMGLSKKEIPYEGVKAHVQAILEGKVKSTGETPRKEVPADTKREAQ